MSTTKSSSRSQINPPTAAPLPSPIPTGKGSRSAANEILSEYLQNSINVPDLSLPLHQAPAEINFQSLASGDKKSLKRLLKSAEELGVFRITCHGIFSDDELGYLAAEGGGVLEETGWDFGEHDGYKERIAWIRSDKTKMKWVRECLRTQIHQPLSIQMQSIAIKLDSVARQLWGVFDEYMGQKPSGKRKLGKESVLSLYRYSENCKMGLNPPSLTKMMDSKRRDHSLSLHLSGRQSQFLVQSEGGPLRFEAGPDNIIVTIGERIEEWSLGNFRCVSEDVVCMPRLQGSQASFSVGLKFLSLDIDISSSNYCDTISVKDQILIGVLIALFYNILVFLFSLYARG